MTNLDTELVGLINSAKEIAPIIKTQMLTTGTFDNSVGLIVGVILAILAAVAFIKIKKVDTAIACVIGGILVFSSFMCIYLSAFNLYKINKTPELYIFEQIKDKK